MFPLGILKKGVDPSKTLVLLHFNGTDGSTDFIDSSPIPYTFTNENAQISSFVVKSGFGTSGFFDNSGGAPYRRLITTTTAPDLRFTNFTIEARIYPTAYNFLVNGIVSSQRVNSDINYNLTIGSGGVLKAEVFGSIISHQTPVSLNQEHHVALVRQGTSFYLYLDGVISTTTPTISQLTIDNYSPVGGLIVGVYASGVGGHFTGYIDELRIRKEAVYTGNFTPPTAPFTF